MGLFSDIGDVFSEQTGFGGGGNPNPHNMSYDPNAFGSYYNDAISGMQAGQNQINSVGTDPASAQMRDSLNGAIQGQLNGLDNNAAGRKKTFQEDMSRGFSADTQNLARAKGGTGSLANSLHNSGQMYDSQARAESSGLNDLYSQATKDIGSLTGDQKSLYGEDLSKATSSAQQGNTLANARLGELSNERGIVSGNNANTTASEQAGAAKRGGSLGALTGGALSFADGGKVAADTGSNFSDRGFYTGNSKLDSSFKDKISGLLKGVGGGGGMGPMAGGAGDEAGGAAAGGGGDLAMLAMAALGGKIPGKAKVRGNSLENDHVPIMASPDEVIVPRSITKSKNPGPKASRFVEDAMSKPAEDHSLEAVAKKRLASGGSR